MRYGDIRSPQDALAYLLDCSLATVEDLARKKTRSKYEYERQISIAQNNLVFCLNFGSNLSRTRAIDVLNKFGNGENCVKLWAESLTAAATNE